jgi:4-amino-4-deoxy-L-arabinose transferase-like glycosyltransferase
MQVRERDLLILLLVWSFLVHLLFGLLTGPPSFWDHYEGRRYLTIAESLVEGRGYAEPVGSMPLYNLVLAGLLWFLGYTTWPVLLLHVSFGVMTTFFTYKIARFLFSNAVAVSAGLLISVHPYLVKLTMQIIDTGPSVALTTCSIWLLLRAWQAPFFNARRYVLAGVAFALATLVRPVVGLYVIILGVGTFLWFAVRRHSRLAIAATAMLWLTWAAVMSPWWLRNYLHYHQFIPLTTYGGFNFLKGHTTYYTEVHPVYDTDHYPYFEPPSVDNDPSGLLYAKSCAQEALAYIKEHPVQAFTADLRKVTWLYTWHKVPRSLANSSPRWDPVLHTVVDDGNPRPAPQDIVYSIYWVPILLLFLFGAVLSRQHYRKLVPIYLVLFANALSVGLTFADTRFRLEVDPDIIMLAGYGLIGSVTRLRASLK